MPLFYCIILLFILISKLSNIFVFFSVSSQYYSQCVPDPSTYKAGLCSGDYQQCFQNTDCCDPGVSSP